MAPPCKENTSSPPLPSLLGSRQQALRKTSWSRRAPLVAFNNASRSCRNRVDLTRMTTSCKVTTLVSIIQLPFSTIKKLKHCNFYWVFKRWSFTKTHQLFHRKVIDFKSLKRPKAFEKKTSAIETVVVYIIFKEWKDTWYIKKGMFGKIRHLLDVPPTQDASGKWRFRLGSTPQKSKKIWWCYWVVL